MNFLFSKTTLLLKFAYITKVNPDTYVLSSELKLADPDFEKVILEW